MADRGRRRPRRARARRRQASVVGRVIQRRRAIVVAAAAAALLAAAAASVYVLFLSSGDTAGQATAPAETARPTERPTVVESALKGAVEDLADYCTDLLASTNEYYGTHQRANLLDELNNPSRDTHRWYVGTRIFLARDYLRTGDTREAVRLLLEALNAEERTAPARQYLPEILETLAVTYLKMGELDNCLSPSGGLICTLPLDKSYVHSNTQGSSSAAEYLLRLLQLEPGNGRATWLLNMAHMTLGTYPEEVPEAYLVPPEALESEYEIGRFTNIAPDAGIYSLDSAGGGIMEDFDNDGLLDLMWSTMDPCKPMKYFHNDGNGLFSDYTSRAGLEGQLGGLNALQTDYNNDGWADVLIMRGGWMLEDGAMRMSLIRNNGDGTFTDVTHQAGVALPAYASQSAAWADYDNDGHLDLYSCNESMYRDETGELRPMYEDTTGAASGRLRSQLFVSEDPSGASRSVFPSQLFRNRGDGTFVEVAARAGVTNDQYCKAAVWGDIDNDGDPDLYLSNLGGGNRLYRNNGDGTFIDVAGALGVAEPLISFATWFWDFDNDGWLDIYVTGYSADVGDIAADYLGLPNKGEWPRLYRNDGAGGFSDVTEEIGVARVHLPMGANFGDLDNDGYLDFYLATGDLTFGTVVPNVMYRNDAGRAFQDVTFSGGFGHTQKGHGIAFGDLDRDGDQDIFAQMGGAYPGDVFSNALFENPGHGNRWVTVRLAGVKSNRAGIGARIKVEAATEDGTQVVYKHVNSGGSFGASPLEQTIGLGRAQRILSLEVYWPTSGTVQVFREVPLDAYLLVREGDEQLTVLEPPRFQFTSVRR